MQPIHHVVLTTYKRSINPGRLQYREVEGPFQVLPTGPVGNKNDIAPCEAHRKRASGDVVGAQIPVELAEIGRINHGLIESLQQGDNRIVAHGRSLGHHPPRE